MLKLLSALVALMLALTGWQGYQFWQNETQRTLPQPTREVPAAKPPAAIRLSEK